MKRKTIRLLASFLLALALFFVGCEDDGPSTKSLLLGKWQITTITLTAYIGDVQIAQESETFETNEMVIELLDGGTGIVYEYGDQVDTFTWTLDGKKMTFPPFGQAPVTGTVDVTKSTLKITWEEQDVVEQITYTIRYQINAVKVS